MKDYATGLVIVSMLLNAILQLTMARWWQSVVFNPGELRKELYQIRLNYWAGALFLTIFMCSYLGNATAVDMMPILYAVFCGAGLSLVHGFFATIKGGWFGLILVYLGIIGLFPFSLICLSILALLDVGINI